MTDPIFFLRTTSIFIFSSSLPEKPYNGGASLIRFNNSGENVNLENRSF